MYGLTECKRVSHLPLAELDRHPGTEVCIVDDNYEKAPPGVIGELIGRGSPVMRGY